MLVVLIAHIRQKVRKRIGWEETRVRLLSEELVTVRQSTPGLSEPTHVLWGRLVSALLPQVYLGIPLGPFGTPEVFNPTAKE